MIAYLVMVVCSFIIAEAVIMCMYRTAQFEVSHYYSDWDSRYKNVWKFKKDLGRKRLTLIQHIMLFIFSLGGATVFIFFAFLMINNSEIKAYKYGDVKTFNTLLSPSNIDNSNSKKTGNKFLDFLNKEI